jgi:hypothetical protein
MFCLLDHPWELDTDVVHHGRSNKYTLVHKGKKITLLPLTPNKIVQCDRTLAETAKREYEIQHDQIASPLNSNAIKLKVILCLLPGLIFLFLPLLMHLFTL